MSNAVDAYKVVVPRELAGLWDALPNTEHEQLSSRLKRAARSAHKHPIAWPAGAPGIHRGRHRAIVGALWVLYQRDDSLRTLSLLGFGRVARVESASL